MATHSACRRATFFVLVHSFVGVQAETEVITITATRGHLRGTSTTVAVTRTTESTGANETSEAMVDAAMKTVGATETMAEPIGANETSGTTFAAAMGHTGGNVTAWRAVVFGADGTLGAAPAAGCIKAWAPCPDDPADCCSGYCGYTDGYTGRISPGGTYVAHAHCY
jgi:hypothetical protein